MYCVEVSLRQWKSASTAGLERSSLPPPCFAGWFHPSGLHTVLLKVSQNKSNVITKELGLEIRLDKPSFFEYRLK
jgi:hypothetical protein